MLKIDWKKSSDWSIRHIYKFIDKNFFNLNTTDIIRFHKLISKKQIANEKFSERWYQTFRDKKSIMYLAGQMVRRNYNLEERDLWKLSPKQFKAFWEYALKIAQYKGSEKTGAKRIRHRYLTKKK